MKPIACIFILRIYNILKSKITEICHGFLLVKKLIKFNAYLHNWLVFGTITHLSIDKFESLFLHRKKNCEIVSFQYIKVLL